MKLLFLTKLIFLWVCLASIPCQDLLAKGPDRPIDRQALIRRHNIEWNNVTGQVPLGNGEFCFNTDGTGLQTFGGNTMSHWGWHSFPLPESVTPDQIPSTGTFQQGRNKGKDIFPKSESVVRNYMFDNPHIINLARIRLVKADGREFLQDEIKSLSRTVDLWSGISIANFTINGHKVRVITCVHPDKDMVSVRIESLLLQRSEIKIAIDFPYPSLQRNNPWVGDFERTENNKTSIIATKQQELRADFRREIDSTIYYASLIWSAGSFLKTPSAEKVNSWLLETTTVTSIEFSCAFSRTQINGQIPAFNQASAACKRYWPAFWKSGGAIDLSESKDSRWKELERRIVLSQYLLAVQSAGSFPPAEGGLMGIDPWRGQFHMEMTWWHLAHYALWNRWKMADQALQCYQNFIPSASKLATQLGYKGYQWPKSVGPEGRSAPWEGNQVLLWKQPHPIFFAELDYRLHPEIATLKKWDAVVEGTATYMADYATRDELTGVYHLDPVMPPSEQGVTTDDVFDLAYFSWALTKAQGWRKRMGLKPNPKWDDVAQRLAPLPTDSGVYIHSPEWTDTYTKRAWEHPNPIGVLGMLPPQKIVDFETAHRTLLKVWNTWDWKRCWGWDFPWTAMAAARLGEPNIAIDALLLDAGTKNKYDERGVCTGGPCPYLPGNGGLLYAVAMMAAGWDGAPTKHAPGFPNDGSWTVRWEGLRRAL